MKIPVYKPSISSKEKEYVIDCLDSTWISSKGEYLSKFEEKFSRKIDVTHSSAVSNGTVALHLALIALGIGPGDEVIVPTLTYIASVNAITYTGAKPVFVDSLANTWQMNPNDIVKKITSRTRAIMAVHLYGHPCEMDEILMIARKHNLFVVEDCAEAFGSKYENKPVGGLGHISTFSFFGNKTITTGEGGMVATNDPILNKRVMHYKGQGLAANRQYWHDVVGYNYRMTNICAAIGLAQLDRADDFIAKKRVIAEKYKVGLNNLPIEIHCQSKNVFHTYWMVSILVAEAKYRDNLMSYLASNGIETRPLFYPVHTMPIYSESSGSHPVAEDIGSRGINLPSWPDMTNQMIDYVVSKIHEFYKVQ